MVGIFSGITHQIKQDLLEHSVYQPIYLLPLPLTVLTKNNFCQESLPQKMIFNRVTNFIWNTQHKKIIKMHI